MAALSSSQYRFAIYDSKANRRSFSEAFDLTILDNTAVPRIAFNGTGTVQDQQVFWPEVVSGPARELLMLEAIDTAARTYATTSCTVQFAVLSAYRDSQQNLQKRVLPLGLADRVTTSTASTRQVPNGVNDNPVTTANIWGPVMSFSPQTNENWKMYSYQLFVSSGT